MKLKKTTLLFLLALLFSLVCRAEELSIEQAYQSVPHQQTRFDAAAANMDAEEKQFLEQFFSLSDQALVERVTYLKNNAENSRYEEILQNLSDLKVPPRITLAHQLLSEAIKDQKAYLERVRTEQIEFNANDPLVDSAHGKLIQTYTVLMSAYPQESAHNKQAFYDHLCALDFK